MDLEGGRGVLIKLSLDDATIMHGMKWDILHPYIKQSHHFWVYYFKLYNKVTTANYGMIVVPSVDVQISRCYMHYSHSRSASICEAYNPGNSFSTSGLSKLIVRCIRTSSSELFSIVFTVCGLSILHWCLFDNLFTVACYRSTESPNRNTWSGEQWMVHAHSVNT